MDHGTVAHLEAIQERVLEGERMNEKHSGLAIRCIHAGEINDANGSPHTSIYITTFKFDSTADLDRALD
ncbi:hypothetical protein SKTS_30120 [Sulfurimicrobium lacus]|uniref:Uncharacterized protein n=1 Tax=Sulfurimicrobium lacus TaxID=2715678 RepID=A0A6F8VGI0_9PROT|nr:hypothetical protein [Sulfurimicrobium lacus]BCB28126.1 hypothetical protein SKTS_30120 [Sulfurimicrobium lacus]